MNGNFYGIHSEICPIPVFRFKKDETMEYVDDQIQSDTHDYDEGEILYMDPCDQKIWDLSALTGYGGSHKSHTQDKTGLSNTERKKYH